MVQWKQIQLVSMRMQVQSLASVTGLRIGIAMSCGVGGRWGSDPMLLWLQGRPAAAAPIQPGNFHMPWCGPKKKKKLHMDFYFVGAWHP